MTTKTYYGKLDCLSSVVTAENLSGEYYKSFCDFMSYLTASNVATLVSWNSGSGAVSGSFNERTYWDGAKRFGLGAHSLWKFHTSSTRNWEWYLYTQVVSGADTVRQTFNTPISGYAGPVGYLNAVSNTGNRGILFQAAVCFSGSSSFNPWNGSISDGSGNASQAAGNGLIRWVSGANARNLYVLPRSNDVGGANSTGKDSGLALGNVHIASVTSLRYHFIYDGDALVVAKSEGLLNTYAFSYIGAFQLRNSLTASGICGSDYGFLMYSGDETNNSIATNTVFGDTAGTTIVRNGGIAVPIKDMVSGSKTAIGNILGTFPDSTYQPNTLVNKFEEFPYYIGVSEAPFVGLVGTFNTGLLKAMRDVQVHDTTADFSRAVFGGSTTVSNLKISTPWTGSSPPGTSTSRTGSNYTWTTDYR